MNSRFSYMRNITFSGLKDHIGLPPSESAIIFLYSTTYNKSLRRPRLLFQRRIEHARNATGITPSWCVGQKERRLLAVRLFS